MASADSTVRFSDELLDYAAIGARVRAARRKHHQTQAALAEQLNLSTSFLGHIERGTRIMSLATFSQLCRVLSLDANYLLFGSCQTLPVGERQLLAEHLYQLWRHVAKDQNFPPASSR